MPKNSKDRKTFTTDFIKGDWDRVSYLDNPHIDNLMSAFLNLGAEFWVMKRRQMIVENLLSAKGSINKEIIDSYNPTAEETLAWSAERDEFIERTFSVLTRPAEKVSPEIPSKKVPAIKAG